jgi:capsular polysaccharide biosynthesis protein
VSGLLGIAVGLAIALALLFVIVKVDERIQRRKRQEAWKRAQVWFDLARKASGE